MNDTLLRSWWVLALRGVVAILFGVVTLYWPQLTLLVLVSLFAAYAIFTGVVSVAGAIRNHSHDDHWWLFLIIGLVGIGAGAITIIHPAITAVVLVMLIGANALMTGVLDIVAAIRLRREIHNEWLLAVSGMAAIVFGVLVFLYPAAGALTLVGVIALYAFITGFLLIASALRLRSISKTGMSDRRVMPDRRISVRHARP
ncbi:MAG TPA: hypothetical protein DHV59_04880 [Oxalobacteraceae bacterium]|nr:hypothetical protein [Oxalobacteraceae bacterium]